MNPPDSDLIVGDDSFDSDSRDSVTIIIDGPGDTTVRPCRPSLLPLLLAERERIARWQEWLKQQPPTEPPGASDTKSADR